jgi:hypothetical protein
MYTTTISVQHHTLLQHHMQQHKHATLVPHSVPQVCWLLLLLPTLRLLLLLLLPAGSPAPRHSHPHT